MSFKTKRMKNATMSKINTQIIAIKIKKTFPLIAIYALEFAQIVHHVRLYYNIQNLMLSLMQFRFHQPLSRFTLAKPLMLYLWPPVPAARLARG